MDRLIRLSESWADRAAEHPEVEPPWVYFLDPSRVLFQRAIAYRDLGRLDLAADAAAAAVDIATEIGGASTVGSLWRARRAVARWDGDLACASSMSCSAV